MNVSRGQPFTSLFCDSQLWVCVSFKFCKICKNINTQKSWFSKERMA